jgi:uncharacterized protein (TIGR00252 family)
MTSTASGREAEARAVDYLGHQGFKIIEQNWRTRFCEIDIVAQKAQTIYFVEVKYRQTANQGSGIEYITPRKLKQMQFAAESWVHAHSWSGAYQLAALAIDGDNISFLDEL